MASLLVTYSINNFKDNFAKLVHNLFRKNLLVLIIAVFLFLLPFLWHGQEVYNLGGDDSRLYLYAPAKYATSTALYSWYGSAFGANNPQQFLLPFLSLATILNYLLPFVNLQNLLYGLIFSVGFLCVYLLINEFCKMTPALNLRRNYPSVIGGLCYVFFPLMYIYWAHPLYREVTGFAAYPLLLLFFFKALNKNEIKYLIYGSALGTIFASATFFRTNFHALLVGIFIFLIVYSLLFRDKRWQTIKYSLLYVLIFVGFNLFWIIPSFFALNTYQGWGSNLAGASAGASSSASNINIYHTLVGLPSPWANNNAYLQMIAPFSVLLLSGFFVASLSKSSNLAIYKMRKIWVSLAIAMVALAFFQTVGVSELGVDLFNWLILNVPGWVMFRTFYRVFSQAYSLFFSLTLGVSFHIISQCKKSEFRILTSISCLKKLVLKLPFKKCLVGSTVLIILIMGFPFIKGDIISQPISPTSDVPITRNVQIPEYYTDAINYLETLGEGRVLSLPLLNGAWSFFSSKTGNGVYVGISPIRVLNGRSDINGFSVFRNQIKSFGPIVTTAIESKNYTALKNFLSLSNVKYIFYNADGISMLSPSNVGNIDSIPGYNKFQNEENLQILIKEMNATEINRFGPIIIYELQEETLYPIVYTAQALVNYNGTVSSFLSSTLHDDLPKKAFYLNDTSISSPAQDYLSEDIFQGTNTSAPSIDIEKVSVVEYEITVAYTDQPFFLVFSDTYDSGWRLYPGKSTGLENVMASQLDAIHFMANGYANGWYVDPSGITKNNDGSFTITLYFWHQSLFYLGVITSFVVLAFCILYLSGLLYKMYKVVFKQPQVIDVARVKN